MNGRMQQLEAFVTLWKHLTYRYGFLLM